MEDDKVVQPDAVGDDLTAPKTGDDVTKPPTGDDIKPPEQPLTEEKIQQMIAEATKLAEERGMETGRRQMQSIKDSEVADAQRRAKMAESESASYKSSFGNLDEDTRKEAELAQLRTQVQTYQQLGKDDAAKATQDAYFKSLHSSLLDNLKTLGIDPENKGIDWAQDEADYLKGRSRFDTSVAKILKENVKVTDQKAEDKFKEMETKLRKDLGLDNVDTTAGSAGGTDSDAEFKKGLGDGSIPLNKANMERAKKLGIA